MGFLLALVCLALSSWAFFKLCCRLIALKKKPLLIAFAFLTALGVGLGISASFFLEYHPRADFRIAGFPIPIVFFHLEDGQWVDFPTPPIQAWLTALANMALLTVLATAPLWLIPSPRPNSAH